MGKLLVGIIDGFAEGITTDEFVEREGRDVHYDAGFAEIGPVVEDAKTGAAAVIPMRAPIKPTPSWGDLPSSRYSKTLGCL